MDDVGLHVSEELEVGRALEKLFGLKPTGHPFLKYKDAVEKVGLLGLGKTSESRLNWKDAIQSLPYQGRYTLSDVEDMTNRLKGKYPDAPLISGVRDFFHRLKYPDAPLISDATGNDVYMKIMQYSPRTLDDREVFHYWSKKPENEILQNAIMDLDIIGL